jgi:hypothetical protein
MRVCMYVCVRACENEKIKIVKGQIQQTRPGSADISSENKLF